MTYLMLYLIKSLYSLPKIIFFMTDKMLKFVKIGQQTPPKREVDQRKKDFNEIYDEYINEKAKEQSSRCSQCGVPFCQVHCPLSNNIPDWLKLTAEGRLKEAYELSQSTNNMPEVCGRICPQDRLCEGNCVIEQSGHGTVTIGSVEKYITDNAWEQGWVKPIEVTNEKNQSVAINTASCFFLNCSKLASLPTSKFCMNSIPPSFKSFVRLSTISFSNLKFGIPYINNPPALS